MPAPLNLESFDLFRPMMLFECSYKETARRISIPTSSLVKLETAVHESSMAEKGFHIH